MASLTAVVTGLLLISWAAMEASANPLEFRLFISEGHSLDSVVLKFSRGDTVTQVTGQERGPPLHGDPGNEGGVAGNLPRYPPQQNQLNIGPTYPQGYYDSGAPPGVQSGLPVSGLGPSVFTVGIGMSLPPGVTTPGYFGGYGSGLSSGVPSSGVLPSNEGFGGGDSGQGFLARGRQG